MKKSTKGSLAGVAAALLLMGGVSTHASWSDDDTVPGTALGTGHLKLINANCDGWLIASTGDDPATVKIAPGEDLTQVCTFEVDALGANLKAKLSVTSPSYASANGLTGALTTSATYEDSTGAAIVPTTELADGEVITATITVSLPSGATNAIQDIDATLKSVTVTATQA